MEHQHFGMVAVDYMSVVDMVAVDDDDDDEVDARCFGLAFVDRTVHSPTSYAPGTVCET